MDTPPDTVAKTHTKRGYGKLMGIDYTRFEVDDNTIKCSFQQKFAFKTLTMNFVKQLQKVDDMNIIFYHTVDSPVDLRGRWIIEPEGRRSRVCLQQVARIPGWARWLPGVEGLITGKIKKIFEQLRAIVI
jgi:hypothetical protein